MAKRGRPPHPDILTPREWQVLDLIDQGLTNDEIARRLGISFDGAKFHVSEILSKLGVSSRHDAAAAAYGHRRGVARRLTAVLPVISLSKAGKLIAAGAIAAAAGALAILIALVLLSDDAGEAFAYYPALYVLDLESGEVTRVADLRGEHVRQYEWTNDGSGFVMAAYSRDSYTHLRILDARTGAIRVQDGLGARGLSFQQLQDGRLAVVIEGMQAAGGAPSDAIAFLEPSTMAVSGLRNFENLDGATWSPDGSQATVRARVRARPTSVRRACFRSRTAR